MMRKENSKERNWWKQREKVTDQKSRKKALAGKRVGSGGPKKKFQKPKKSVDPRTKMADDVKSP